MGNSIQKILPGKNLLKIAVALAVIALAAASSAQAADVVGAKDPAFLKRYAGADIISYRAIPYDSYNVAAPDPKNSSSWVFSPIEGQITRLIYHVPSGHTPLELLRNYEQALKGVGFTQTAERTPFNDAAFSDAFYLQGWQLPQSGTPMWGYPYNSKWQQMGYVTAKGAAGGQNVTIAVFVGTYNSDFDLNYGKSAHFTPDSPLVIVDVVSQKGVVNQMVTVKAADIADALSKKGFIDLYGIYFDTDKAVVKPDSTSTLDEVASLLKIDLSLKLEISGHTDNTGAKDHNLKLSQDRAQAVMRVLVTKYGIDPKRLTAKGYGDTKPVAPNNTDANKAKNRRVELKKI